jgi:hypothetical protein
MNTILNVRFLLRAPKKSKNGFQTIYLRLSVGLDCAEISTRRLVDPALWDPHAERLAGPRRESIRQLNSYLDTLQAQVFQSQRELMNIPPKTLRCAQQGFDFNFDFITQSLGGYSLKLIRTKHLCSLKLIQEAFPDLASYRLKDLADYFKIELQHHNAMSDAKACARLTIMALPKVNHPSSTGIRRT